MADGPQYVRIFLSSPGDVAVERGLAARIIEKLNREPLLRYVHLDMVAWDDPNKRTPMLATKTPQQAIDEGLPRPSQCPIVVVIFWGRMGSPLDEDSHGTKPNGDPYWSGTEWEYLDAMQGVAENGTGMPYVVVYRRTDTRHHRNWAIPTTKKQVFSTGGCSSSLRTSGRKGCSNGG